MANFISRTICVPASYAALVELRTFVARTAQEAGLNDRECDELSLAVDEAASNIITHALQQTDCDLQCSCNVDKEAQVVRCELTYIAPIQPPSSSPSRDEIEARVASLKRGGLGIYLMHSLVDTIEYAVENGQNIIRLIKMHRV